MNDPVTTGVIAERLNTHRQTVRSWRIKDETFPIAAGKIAGAEVWEWQTILDWCTHASKSVIAMTGAIHRAIRLANGLATAGAAGFLVSIMAAEGSMILAAIASGLALASIMAARFLWAEIEEVTGRNDLTNPEVER